jgi:hypothetical protein
MLTLDTPCSVFQSGRCLASGRLSEVALPMKAALDASARSLQAPPVLLLDDTSAEVSDLDWRGTPKEVLARLKAMVAATPDPATAGVSDEPDNAAPAPGAAPARGPGRPKLGVVAREVTLLPRHWDWLATQPGGASVALRKLVEVARRDSETRDRVRHASAVAYRFMSTIAGHEAGFEEASRALFAGDQAGFDVLIAGWPVDVQHHLKRLAADAFRA